MKISNNLFQKKTIRPWQVVAGHWVGGLNRAREPVGRCWHSIETDSVEAERRPLFGGSVPATAVCCKTLLSGWRYPNRRVQQPAYRQGGGASGSMNPLLHRRAFRAVKRESGIPPVPTCGSEPRRCAVGNMIRYFRLSPCSCILPSLSTAQCFGNTLYPTGGGASGSMNSLLHRRAFRTVNRESGIPPVPTCGSEPAFVSAPPPLRRGNMTGHFRLSCVRVSLRP